MAVKSKAGVEAGLFGEEGGQAVPIDHFKGAAFGNVGAPDAVEGDAVQVASQANANLIGLVLGAAGEIEGHDWRPAPL